MLRGRVASLFAQGMPPRFETPDPGGLASGLEGLVPRGRSPGAPCSSWYGVTKNPNPSPLLLI